MRFSCIEGCVDADRSNPRKALSAEKIRTLPNPRPQSHRRPREQPELSSQAQHCVSNWPVRGAVQQVWPGYFSLSQTVVFQRRIFIDQFGAGIDFFDRVADQGLDFPGGPGAALRQIAHFRSHHRKAATLLARACRFDGCIQCENIGLEGDAVDHADDVDDLLAF